MADKQDIREKINALLSTLSPREERVLRMRFGLGMDKMHTQEEVALEFAVTVERVREIEEKAMQKLSGQGQDLIQKLNKEDL